MIRSKEECVELQNTYIKEFKNDLKRWKELSRESAIIRCTSEAIEILESTIHHLTEERTAKAKKATLLEGSSKYMCGHCTNCNPRNSNYCSHCGCQLIKD